MGQEIERKFLVRGSGWREAASPPSRLCQGYLALNGLVSVRVRIAEDEGAWLTIKTAAPGLVRQEYEYAIPPADAQSLLALCGGSLVVKLRHRVPGDGGTWEIDVFEGDNAGLVVAEIELPAPDAAFARPDWLGEEVTGDARYANQSLAFRPWRDWRPD